jgi:signal transduction histidine kinase
MTVSDDGCGFSLVPAGSGSGLLNMRDRADAVGGSLRVDSRPGHGTVIGVRVPFAPAAPVSLVGPVSPVSRGGA